MIVSNAALYGILIKYAMEFFLSNNKLEAITFVRGKTCVSVLKAYGYKKWYVEANNCQKGIESLVEPLQSQALTLQNDDVFFFLEKQDVCAGCVCLYTQD